MSSDQQQFQVLTYEQIQLDEPQSPQKYQSNNKNANNKNTNLHYANNPTMSVIKFSKQLTANIFKVQIVQSQNKVDMNILQNQFYTVKLIKKQVIMKENLQRRYSDFDLLYEILEKKYPGFVFPGFPQKGIVSYVKTKVSVTKDQMYMKNRIKMIQRFFTIILNDQKFNCQKCLEIKKFFAKDEQFQIFKKTSKQELSRSKNLVDSTWNFVKSYFTFNQASKYTPIVEQIKKQKQPFEQLAIKTNQIYGLVKDELQMNTTLSNCQQTQLCDKILPAFSNLKKLVSQYTKKLTPISTQLSELQFTLFCQNQDYMMVLKKIQLIEQMKQSQQNYKNLSAIEDEFAKKKQEIQLSKKYKLQQIRKQLKDILERINQVQRYRQ